MTARDVRRSALGAGRLLLGVIMAIFVPVWLGFSLVDYSRPTVPASELVTPSVDVYDETGSFEPIDGRTLQDILGGVAFARPIHLVILSTDDLADDNLDEATLMYARAGHKEWISPNGYKWADGYLILSVSPTYRKVGTYFGEDIAQLLSVQEKIQEAAKDDFRAGRWSEGMVAAATKAAAYIPDESGRSIENRVVWPNWMGWLISLTGIGVLVRGHSLRRTVRERSERIAELWAQMENRRPEVDQAFHSVIDAGHYSMGLTARYECANQERKKVRERVSVLRSPGFSDPSAPAQPARGRICSKISSCCRPPMTRLSRPATFSRSHQRGALCGTTRWGRSSKTCWRRTPSRSRCATASRSVE